MAKLLAYQIGEGLQTFLRTNIPEVTGTDYSIDDLEESNVRWTRIMVPEPYYILDTNDALPCVKIKFLSAEVLEKMPNYKLNVEYRFGLYFYRTQTPGDEHHKLLIQDLEKIFNSFTNSVTQWRPLAIINSIGDDGQLYEALPAGIIAHDELKYRIDVPNKRISVGEVVIIVKAFSY